MEFQFKNTKKYLEIKDSTGEVIKKYTIDVGNDILMKRIVPIVKELQSMNKADIDDPEVIEKIIDLEKKIIDGSLNDWDRLWDACDHNIFSMMELVKAVSSLIGENGAV